VRRGSKRARWVRLSDAHYRGLNGPEFRASEGMHFVPNIRSKIFALILLKILLRRCHAAAKYCDAAFSLTCYLKVISCFFSRRAGGDGLRWPTKAAAARSQDFRYHFKRTGD
jgi:hypothetical protein